MPVALAQHFISLSGQLGEHSWVGKIPSSTIQNSSLGVATGLGVNYDLKYGHFLFTVGVTGNYSHSTFFSNQRFTFLTNDADNVGHIPTVDGVRGDFWFNYDFYKRKDSYNNVTVQVPLMMGGKWRHFYFLLGAKFETMTMWGNWKSTAEFNSYGEYSSILGAKIRHMPEYGFYDAEKLNNKADAAFNLNVLASAELGYWFVPDLYVSSRLKAPIVCRVGAYMDYGVLNAYNFSYAPAYLTPAYNPASASDMNQVQLVDYLSSAARRSAVHPVEAGVKFTLMFMLPTKQPCVLCNDDLPNIKHHRGGGRVDAN